MVLRPILNIIYITLCLNFITTSHSFASEKSFRSETVNINNNWEFKVIDSSNSDLKWQSVNLPHTPKIEPIIVNSQWQGLAEYQKALELNPTWKTSQIFIRFEGAMNHSEVWLNNTKIGEHLGGYLPFTLELTDYLNFDQPNIIKVKLSNIDNPIIGPKPLEKLDFNTYGGLYREVKLLVKNRLHITDEIFANEVASGGVFITYPKVSSSESQIKINTHVANEYSSKKAFVIKQTLQFENTVVGESSLSIKQLAANTAQQFSQELAVKRPKLWSPTSPNLYTLNTEVYLDNQLIDQKLTKLGIRKFEFSAQHELLINGKKTFLRGVNRHQEYPHVGYATSPQADYRDAVKIKSAGFDYVRLSHYPHSKAFMNAADELGLVLIDAILGWQYYLEDPKFKQQIKNTCHDLIRRDRNHPSVLAWECSLNESWMPEKFIEDLHNIVKQEYPGGYSAGWQHGYDMYLQARQHRQKHYETPTQPYNVSEYGDWEYYAQNAGLNQDSWADLKEEERTSRQLLNSGEARLLQQAKNLQEAHNDNLSTPAFADGYWVMFDYNRGYADDLEASGIMSLFRLPKYSYYFYQSQRDPDIISSKYDSGPMVHIASEWNKNSAKNVTVFSNAEQVELWLNDRLIAKQSPLQDKFSTHLPHPPFEFNIDKFVAGKLEAKAYIKGKLVASHQVVTPKAPASIELSLDISGKEPAINVQDLIFVYATVLDEKGNLVPINGQNLVFNTTGDIEIIHSNEANTEQGKAAILLKIGKSLDQATIQVSSKTLGIQSETLFLKTYIGENNEHK